MSENSKVIIERLDENRKHSLKHYADLSLRWNELGNNRSAELSKHLFTIAALVLPISLVPVTQGNELLLDSFCGKVFLLISCLSFVLSLFFGMIQLIKESDFYNNWAKQEGDKSNVFVKPIRTSNPAVAEEVVDKMHDDADKLDKLPHKTPQKFLKLQMAALLVGMAFIGATLVAILFDNKQPQNNQDKCSYTQAGCSKKPRHLYYYR